MNDSEQQTLNDLQLPTISLIEKFCQTPPEVKDYFMGVLSVYENNPTQDTINKINEVVKAPTSRDAKMQWLKKELKIVPPSVIKTVKHKYIEPKAPIPVGLPRSGELMTFLDYVSKNTKDSLIDAQAAARILSHIDNGKYDIKSTLIYTDSNGEIKEQKEYLNKPFATPIQRVEQLTEFLSSYKVNEENMLFAKKHDDMLYNLIDKDNMTPIPQIDIALEECKKMALTTLTRTAENISVDYPQAAQRISSLANAYGGDKNSLADINLISQTVKNAAKISTLYYGAEFVSADSPISEGIKSFSKEEAELFQTIINKRLNKIQPQLINSTILMPTR